MIAATTPNPYTLLGLLFLAYGLGLFALSHTRLAHVAANEYERQIRTTCIRSAAMCFAAPLIAGGLLFQAVGQFYSALPQVVIVLTMLGLCLWLIAYLTAGDLLAEQMTNRTLPRQTQQDATVHMLRSSDDDTDTVSEPLASVG